MNDHKPAHYVAGVPVAITLINSNEEEHKDWLWRECPSCTESELYEGIADMLCASELESAAAGYSMIKAMQVYDDAWARRFEPLDRNK